MKAANLSCALQPGTCTAKGLLVAFLLQQSLLSLRQRDVMDAGCNARTAWVQLMQKRKAWKGNREAGEAMQRLQGVFHATALQRQSMAPMTFWVIRQSKHCIVSFSPCTQSNMVEKTLAIRTFGLQVVIQRYHCCRGHLPLFQDAIVPLYNNT